MPTDSSSDPELEAPRRNQPGYRRSALPRGSSWRDGFGPPPGRIWPWASDPDVEWERLSTIHTHGAFPQFPTFLVYITHIIRIKRPAGIDEPASIPPSLRARHVPNSFATVRHPAALLALHRAPRGSQTPAPAEAAATERFSRAVCTGSRWDRPLVVRADGSFPMRRRRSARGRTPSSASASAISDAGRSFLLLGRGAGSLGVQLTQPHARLSGHRARVVRCLGLPDLSGRGHVARQRVGPRCVGSQD
jgi:hypothetical protein